MNTANPLFWPLIASAALGLGACGGGGGGGGTAQATITAEDVADMVADVDASLANCTSTGATAKLSMAGASETLQEMLAVSRSLAVDQQDGQHKVARFKLQSKVSGSCGSNPGDATVTSEHANGVTDYQLVFDNFCTEGPQGDVVYDGEITGKEIGTPSNSGPIISEFRMSTPDLAVQPTGTDDGPFHVTLENARTSYGNPDTFSPGTPTSGSPDVTTIGKLRINDTGRGEIHEVRNVTMIRHGGNNATVDIRDGSYVNPDGESVSVSTPDAEPLQVQISTGLVSSGAVELTGAEDSSARLVPVSGTRELEITVNGEALADLDCADADDQIAETIDILIGQLPIY